MFWMSVSTLAADVPADVLRRQPVGDRRRVDTRRDRLVRIDEVVSSRSMTARLSSSRTTRLGAGAREPRQFVGDHGDRRDLREQQRGRGRVELRDRLGLAFTDPRRRRARGLALDLHVERHAPQRRIPLVPNLPTMVRGRRYSRNATLEHLGLREQRRGVVRIGRGAAGDRGLGLQVRVDALSGSGTASWRSAAG
jgi:hypothetical protein